MPRQSKPHVHKGRWISTIRGKAHDLGKFGGVAQERAAFAKFYQLMAESVRPDDAGDAPSTINGAVVGWLQLHTNPCYPQWLRHFRRFAGSVRLADVGKDVLTRFYLHLQGVRYQRLGKIVDKGTGERAKLPPKPLATKTVRHLVHAAAAVLKWAHGAGWPRVLPDTPKIAKAMRGARDVDPALLWATIDALPDRSQRILRFIAGTGCRPSEACALEWAHVHLDAGVCILPRHKTADVTGEPRTLCLTDEARAALKGLTPSRGPVFKSGRGGAYTPAGLRAILRRHGNFTPYALRHTFAQTASEADVPVDVLGKLLGHRDTATTQRYYEIRNKRAVGAAARLQLRPKGKSAAG